MPPQHAWAQVFTPAVQFAMVLLYLTLVAACKCLQCCIRTIRRHSKSYSCRLSYPLAWLCAATWRAAARNVETPAAAEAPEPRSMHLRDAQTLLWKTSMAWAADHD